MTCRETKNLLNAYVDGELDSAGSLSIEHHVQGCSSCLAQLENLHSLSAAIESGGVRYAAPPRLKKNVTAAIRAVGPPPRRNLFNWRWTAALASAAAVVLLLWVVSTQRTKSTDEAQLVNDLLSTHIRSTLANHITDVASSDSHTVKPWFAGKLDYSPPAKDLTEQGYPLIGGRLDYLENRPVAALVYRRTQHLINLFVWPSSDTSIPPQDQLSRQGYNILHWTNSGMTYWLVSELNLAELSECARLLKE